MNNWIPPSADRPPVSSESRFSRTIRLHRGKFIVGFIVAIGGLGMIGELTSPTDDDPSVAEAATVETTPIPELSATKVETTQPVIAAAPPSAPVTSTFPSTTTIAAATTTTPPVPTPQEPVAQSLRVTHVVDGDTVDVSTGERIRLIGIDTPERGECGFDEATRRVEELVAGASVVLVAGAHDDVDRYGRLLRYVDADGVDVGEVLLAEGLAISRYDSRDGYGSHPRETGYRLADAAAQDQCTGRTVAESQVASSGEDAPAQPASPPAASTSDAPSGIYFTNCDAARAAGAAPLLVGDPGYRGPLDRDNDGVACE